MINEDNTVYNMPNFQKSLMIPRSEMPQIDSTSREGLFSWLKKTAGIENEWVDLSTAELNPSQCQVNMDKISSLRTDPGVAEKPIIVSNDNYVLDGHHTWMANHLNGNQQKCVRLGAPASQCLDLMKAYPKSFTKGINENMIKEDSFEMWKQHVISKYPAHKDVMRFVSKPDTLHVSAELPNEDRSYGFYDINKGEGHVLESLEPENKQAIKDVMTSIKNRLVKSIEENLMTLGEALILEWDEDKNWEKHGEGITKAIQNDAYRSPVDGEDHKKVWADTVEKTDPTPNKQYAPWLSRMHAKQGHEGEDRLSHSLEDIQSSISSGLDKYHKHKNKKTLEQHGVPSDINKIKSFTEFQNHVDKLPEVQTKSEKKQAVKDDLEGQYTKSENEHWTHIIPHTEKASQHYGQNSKWCTTASRNCMFDSYNKEGHLHILIPKKPEYSGEKYQVHFERGEFSNEQNTTHNDIHGLFTKRPAPDSYNKVVNDILDKHLGSVNESVSEELNESINEAYGDEDEADERARIASKTSSKEELSSALNDKSQYVRKSSMKNPNATDDHISKALSDSVWGVRAQAANHPNATDDHISKALDDQKSFVRQEAVRHPKISSKNLDKALLDKDPEVRILAIRHQNATRDHISKAINDTDPRVRDVAKKAMMAKKALDDSNSESR